MMRLRNIAYWVLIGVAVFVSKWIISNFGYKKSVFLRKNA
jgi:hypothetical protein